MEIDLKKIEESVIKQAVDEIVDNDDIFEKVKKKVDAKIDALFAEKADQIIQETVNVAVRDGLNRQFIAVDRFGQPVGEPTTISAELERLIAGYWTERVEKNTGKKTDSSYSSVSRAEYVLMQICADDFMAEAKQHMVNVTASLKDNLRTTVAAQLNQVFDDLFRVKSAQDKRDGPDNPLTGK